MGWNLNLPFGVAMTPNATASKQATDHRLACTQSNETEQDAERLTRRIAQITINADPVIRGAWKDVMRECAGALRVAYERGCAAMAEHAAKFLDCYEEKDLAAAMRLLKHPEDESTP